MLRLKSLELHGFKSFADKTKLTFPGGISCVVGPNGCGKSNIADAVSWVLGEQSAKSLRGDKMEDVIFAGSSSRKPSSHAEVTMTWIRLEALQADDEDQLVITRRLYRNGVSEYLMNASVCRLKDIQSALMDFGMGTRAYSLIEQGRIGQIINSKPTDRRGIIEEAAGILKYKLRRRESELKLRAAEDNLTRINDIINEVQKQRAHLNRQVGKARRYKNIKDEMRELEHSILVFDLTHMNRELARLAQSYNDANGREAKIHAEIGKLDANITALRQKMIAAEQNLRTLEATHNKHISDIALAEAQIAFSQSKATERQQQLTAYAQDRLNADEEQARLTQRIAERDTEHKALEGQLAAQSQTQDQQKQVVDRVSLNLATVTSELDTSYKQHRDAVANKMAAEAELKQIQQQLASMADQHKRVMQQLSEHDRELLDLSQSRTKFEALRQEQQVELDTLQKSLQKQTEEHELSLNQRTSARQLAQELGQKKQSLTDRLNHLESLWQSKRDVSDDAKRILQRTGLKLLRDVLDSNHTHDAAVEAALEHLLEAFVVDDDGQAELLSKAASGSTYRVINLAANLEETRELEVPPGATLLIELLRADHHLLAHIKPLIAHLALAPECPVEDLKVLALAHAHLTFVARDGKSLVQGSLTQYRSPGKSLGFLTMKGEIQDTQAARTANEQALSEAEQAKVIAEDRAKQAAETLDGIKQKRIALERDHMVLQQQLHHVEATHQRLQQRVILDKSQAEQLNQNQHQLKDRASALETERSRAEEQIATHASQVRQLEAQVAIQRQAHHEAHTELTRVTEQLRGMILMVQRLKSDMEHLKQTREQLQHRISKGEDQKKAWEADIQTCLTQVTEHQVAIKNLMHLRSEAEASVKQSEAQLKQQQTTADQLEAQRKQLHQNRDDVRAEQGRYELETARLSSKVAHLEDRFLSNRGEPFSLAKSGTPLDPETIDAARFELEDLTRKLSSLGTVNLLAIEEFDEIETRYAFLVDQQKDLIDSIAEIRTTIHNLNRVSVEKFKKAFEAINRDFGSIFVDLFGGGEARLELLDESDMLETGIDMLVQPPGKKLQNAMLMSGGEKALTAIALLLAVFQFRPSPFCLLDEVDAPLDDANVSRFIHKIEELKGETQFIVITHQKPTMAAASSLFGVTMENTGCSKLVSVRFD
ncbi:MAG: chromosome segregation protein SMC [Acidobacteria bacterium]|nr:chromosome segregation protein SMC [Acidobacteriota bacterium]